MQVGVVARYKNFTIYFLVYFIALLSVNHILKSLGHAEDNTNDPMKGQLLMSIAEKPGDNSTTVNEELLFIEEREGGAPQVRKLNLGKEQRESLAQFFGKRVKLKLGSGDTSVTSIIEDKRGSSNKEDSNSGGMMNMTTGCGPGSLCPVSHAAVLVTQTVKLSNGNITTQPAPMSLSQIMNMANTVQNSVQSDSSQSFKLAGLINSSQPADFYEVSVDFSDLPAGCNIYEKREIVKAALIDLYPSVNFDDYRVFSMAVMQTGPQGCSYPGVGYVCFPGLLFTGTSGIWTHEIMHNLCKSHTSAAGSNCFDEHGADPQKILAAGCTISEYASSCRMGSSGSLSAGQKSTGLESNNGSGLIEEAYIMQLDPTSFTELEIDLQNYTSTPQGTNPQLIKIPHPYLPDLYLYIYRLGYDIFIDLGRDLLTHKVYRLKTINFVGQAYQDNRVGVTIENMGNGRAKITSTATSNGIPEAPQNLTASKGESSEWIRLNWDPPLASVNVYAYNIFRNGDCNSANYLGYVPAAQREFFDNQAPILQRVTYSVATVIDNETVCSEFAKGWKKR